MIQDEQDLCLYTYIVLYNKYLGKYLGTWSPYSAELPELGWGARPHPSFESVRASGLGSGDRFWAFAYQRAPGLSRIFEALRLVIGPYLACID